jgi:hypothetical protein
MPRGTPRLTLGPISTMNEGCKTATGRRAAPAAAARPR